MMRQDTRNATIREGSVISGTPFDLKIARIDRDLIECRVINLRCQGTADYISEQMELSFVKIGEARYRGEQQFNDKNFGEHRFLIVGKRLLRDLDE